MQLEEDSNMNITQIRLQNSYLTRYRALLIILVKEINYTRKNILLKQVGRYFYPLIDKTPIKIAQFKITNLDNEDYINLEKFIGYENKFEGMFYLWKGLLPSEINQSILFKI